MRRHLAVAALIMLAAVLWNEFLVHVAVMQLWCSWPELSPDGAAVHALVLADVHMLGPERGHWFDRLRREWAVGRAYRAALSALRPDVVFVLGDTFDEGRTVTALEWQRYLARLDSVLPRAAGVRVEYAVGNHDAGDHFRGLVDARNIDRFQSSFGDTTRAVTIGNVSFVLVNSLGLKGDACALCAHTAERVRLLGAAYAQPVVLLHYPLYRASERACDEAATDAPESLRDVPNRVHMDVLSHTASVQLLEALQPRLVVSAHTHHTCERTHVLSDGRAVREITVSTASWRNRNDPSVALLSLGSGGGLTGVAHRTCGLAREWTAIAVYILAGAGALLVLFLSGLQRNRQHAD